MVNLIIHAAASTALLAGGALAGIEWIKANDMCAGVNSDCSDAKSCTQTAYGPCKGSAKSPDAYFTQHSVGLAYVDSTKYLECGNPKLCEDMLVIDESAGTYRDLSGNVKIGTDAEDTRYAYMMTGALFGDKNSGWPTWGYVGTSSALSLGKGTLATKHVPVFSASPLNMTRVQRDDSDAGAPNGPYNLCITKVQGGVCNGGDIKFNTGEFKFNIFGAGGGVEWDATVKAGKNGFPKGMDKMGVRQQITAVGFQPKDLYVNGVPYNDAYKNLHVKFITILHEKGGIDVKFPQFYNVGKTANAKENENMDVSETKNVEIRVHGVDGNSIYVDYLFDVIEEGQYFIYDPDVVNVDAIPPAPPGTPGAPAPPGAPAAPEGSGSYTVPSTVVTIFAAFVMTLSM